MGAQLRVYKQKIASAQTTKKITKAMELIAASRIQKAMARVRASSPFARAVTRAVSAVATHSNTQHPLTTERENIRRSAVVIFASDRGLAGGFNANVIRRAALFMREVRRNGAEVTVVTVGRKGRDWLLRYDPVVRAEFTGMPDNPTTYHVGPIVRVLIDDFLSGHVDEVHMIYTDFINTIKQEPHVHKLLPIQPAEGSEGMAPEYIFEPSPEAVLSRVLYGFTEVQVLQALYESLASEHSARMVAMRNATDAAGELIDDLTLTYNKARQSGITNELMDIIGGTAALES
jgi:F-type H+-transporting ATPase subunit gamma